MKNFSLVFKFEEIFLRMARKLTIDLYLSFIDRSIN
jgi:hypothetical protein